jgi:hypothetical protein
MPLSITLLCGNLLLGLGESPRSLGRIGQVRSAGPVRRELYFARLPHKHQQTLQRKALKLSGHTGPLLASAPASVCIHVLHRRARRRCHVADGGGCSETRC